MLDALRMLLPQLPQALQQQAAGGGGGGPGPGLGSGSGGAAAATASPYRESRRLGSVLAAAGDRGHLLSDECSGLADALGGGRLRPNESDSNSASTAPTVGAAGTSDNYRRTYHRKLHAACVESRRASYAPVLAMSPGLLAWWLPLSPATGVPTHA